ncbi:cysteine hydrolase family protein [Planococcus sp. FY231025]|uniref:cysteine hydrolase family protein n=1 Tax=Planococcus sp. FY231025 TaxID=3455699 RepID=UPI003F8EF31C
MNMEKTALVIVDVQKAFADLSWGKRNNPEAEANILKILQAWREQDACVIHIQHQSDNPNSLFFPEKESYGIIEPLQPIGDEPVFAKKVNSAFIGTDLEGFLRLRGLMEIVIVGLTTPHCISTTTRMSGNLGFKTCLVSDATAAFELTGPDGRRYDAEIIHDVTLAALHGEFAEVITTKGLLAKVGGNAPEQEKMANG